LDPPSEAEKELKKTGEMVILAKEIVGGKGVLHR
jgi:hypothetical protein